MLNSLLRLGKLTFMDNPTIHDWWKVSRQSSLKQLHSHLCLLLFLSQPYSFLLVLFIFLKLLFSIHLTAMVNICQIYSYLIFLFYLNFTSFSQNILVARLCKQEEQLILLSQELLPKLYMHWQMVI